MEELSGIFRPVARGLILDSGNYAVYKKYIRAYSFASVLPMRIQDL